MSKCYKTSENGVGFAPSYLLPQLNDGGVYYEVDGELVRIYPNGLYYRSPEYSRQLVETTQNPKD